jgi:hypothetical protein
MKLRVTGGDGRFGGTKGEAAGIIIFMGRGTGTSDR